MPLCTFCGLRPAWAGMDICLPCWGELHGEPCRRRENQDADSEVRDVYVP